MTEISDAEEEECVQKMNIYLSYSDDDFSEELHYSEQEEESDIEVTSERTDVSEDESESSWS